ncbi:MAG: nitroreductase family protein [Thermoanaerobaculaceae bacterium]|nr:nitroreductase family protein [Thermoanaerobaculaceae bacterium]TAM48296.1 MAG: NADPH-dependent oxidoreductase [Acidobacteriota bacterium]
MNADPILAPHRSIRLFSPKPLPDGTLERLVAEAQRAPTDATGQMYSFVRILDRGRRQRIAVLSGEQQHVLDAAEFLVACADTHRLTRVLELHGRAPGDYPATGLHFAVIDATLATQRLIDAAEAIGLGTVCIGGILNGVEELVELLALPRGVLPLFGLCLGWPGEEPVARPRVALASVLHADAYRDLTTAEAAADVAAMAPITRSGDWPAVLARYFAAGGTMEAREPALRRALDRQGFAWR